MTVEEKRRIVANHCTECGCIDCKLGGTWEHHCSCGDMGVEYLEIASASEEELDRAIQQINSDADDPVSHPSHYTQGNIECIDAMVAAFGKDAVNIFCLLNAFKYLWRAEYKNGNEDLNKAIWYLKKRLELSTNE